MSESDGCTCCQVQTNRPGAGDDECPKCGHLMKRHYRIAGTPGDDDAAGMYRLAGHGLPLDRTLGNAIARAGLAAVDAALKAAGPLTCERCGARVHNLSADGQCITCIAGATR